MTTKRRGCSVGFTVVELLVVIGIVILLAIVALGPITRGIHFPGEPSQVQNAHQLGALCFAYSNDNNGNYPYGPDGHTIANLLVNGDYANNPSIFYYDKTPGCTKYTGSTSPYNLTAANCSWDFWVSGSNGLPKDTNDQTPLVQQTAGIAMNGLPTEAGAGATLTIDPRKTTFGSDGIVVYYKGNNTVFIKCSPASPSTAVNLPTSPVPYVGPTYADPLGASYHSVLP